MWWSTWRLKSKNSDKRFAVASKLARKGDHRAVEALIRTLAESPYSWETEKQSQQHQAVQLLGELQDPRALGPLLAFLEKNDDVKLDIDDILQALQKLKYPIASALALAVRRHFKIKKTSDYGLLKSEGKRSLYAQFKSHLKRLGEIQPIGAVELRKLLHELPSSAQPGFIEDLWELGKPGVDLSVAFLRNLAPSERARCIRLLKRMGWEPTTAEQEGWIREEEIETGNRNRERQAIDLVNRLVRHVPEEDINGALSSMHEAKEALGPLLVLMESCPSAFRIEDLNRLRQLPEEAQYEGREWDEPVVKRLWLGELRRKLITMPR
jgi:hypothetical protein